MRILFIAAIVALLPVATPTVARVEQREAPQALAAVPLTIVTPRRTIRFRAELARTADQQSRGLMFRRSLRPHQGMLFPFPVQRVASFWMKNTLIPLDMIFIRADGTVARVAANTRPLSLDPVTSGEPVAAVFEIAGGQAAKLGIDERARVTWRR